MYREVVDQVSATGVMAALASGNRGSASSILWLAGIVVIFAIGLVVRVLGTRYRNRGPR